MIQHDLWFHDSLGWFAVRLEEGVVTGICGPLSWHRALDREFDPATCSEREKPNWRAIAKQRFRNQRQRARRLGVRPALNKHKNKTPWDWSQGVLF